MNKKRAEHATKSHMTSVAGTHFRVDREIYQLKYCVCYCTSTVLVVVNNNRILAVPSVMYFVERIAKKTQRKWPRKTGDETGGK